MLTDAINRPAEGSREANRRRSRGRIAEWTGQKGELWCDAWTGALSRLRVWAILAAARESLGCKAAASLAMKGCLRPRRVYVCLPAELGKPIKSPEAVTVLGCEPRPGRNDRV